MTLSEAEKILAEAGIEDARDEARLIFSSVGGEPAYKLLSPSFNSDSEAVRSAVLRRAEREPLAYILGEWDFYRESYFVTPDCLIPRSDTELLVDFAVKNLPRGAKFLDLCTGSGCVAISTLKNTEDTTALALDISEGALSVAEKNAARCGVSPRLTLILEDALTYTPNERVFAVLSNPPYVADDCYPTLEAEIFHEPKAAFVGGADGGDFYRAITPIYRDIIDDEGFIAFEIGYDQGELLRKIAAEHSMNCEILKDLGGRARVAVLRKA